MSWQTRGDSVAVDADDRAVLVRIRPRQSLMISGLLVLFIVPLPIFGTLIALGVQNGLWPLAAVGVMFSILLCVQGYLSFRSTFVAVTATSIVERGFFGRTTSVPRSKVDTMVLAFTYSGSSSETLPQLLVRDNDGVRLLRLRGVFWTEESMRQVATAIGGALELPPEPMTSEQFFGRFTGGAYWFENRPALVVGAIGILLVVSVGLVLGLMLLLGLPIGGNS